MFCDCCLTATKIICGDKDQLNLQKHPEFRLSASVGFKFCLVFQSLKITFK